MQQAFCFALRLHNAHIHRLLINFATCDSCINIMLLGVHGKEEQCFIKNVTDEYNISVVDLCEHGIHEINDIDSLYTRNILPISSAIVFFNLDIFLKNASLADRVVAENKMSSIIDSLHNIGASILFTSSSKISTITVDLRSRLSGFYVENIRYA